MSRRRTDLLAIGYPGDDEIVQVIDGGSPKKIGSSCIPRRRWCTELRLDDSMTCIALWNLHLNTTLHTIADYRTVS